MNPEFPLDSRTATPGDLVRLSVSVVSCAYNEEASIGGFLQGVLASEGLSFLLREVIVVASGCTDRTEEIVELISRRDPRVQLISQRERQGKAFALNTGLRCGNGDIIVIAGSDTVPDRLAIDELVRPFADPNVSLVCGRPVPTNGSDSFVARMGDTLWNLHDAVSRISPKVGEAYAIRRMEIRIPTDVQDDDTYVGSMAQRRTGGGAAYAAKAIFYNRVPTTARDFLRQRWRINRQQLGLRRIQSIRSSTWNPGVMLVALASFVRGRTGNLRYLLPLALSESVIRGGAFAVGLALRAPVVRWAPIDSTKGTAVASGHRDDRNL